MALEDHSLFVGSIFVQMGHLNPDRIVVFVGNLGLCFFEGAVGVWAGVETSSEAW